MLLCCCAAVLSVCCCAGVLLRCCAVWYCMLIQVFFIFRAPPSSSGTCCSGAAICRKCWSFMTVAVKVLDTALRSDFGYKHILWIYSGRRGVHCWVCDPDARALTDDARSAVGDFLNVITGNEKSSAADRVPITFPLHPSFERFMEPLEEMFVEQVISMQGQKLLCAPEVRRRGDGRRLRGGGGDDVRGEVRGG